MQNPELLILALNTAVVLVAYLIIYPRFCGTDIIAIAKNDLIATVIVLVIAGSVFWGSGQEFSLIFFSVNWFWFTLLTYAAIEIPFMLWYCKKYQIRLDQL